MPRPTKGYILTTVEHEPLYQYQALHTPDAIRIVVIERGQRSPTLKCSILQCLRGEHSYEALSYEWGLPSADDPSIMIDEARLRIRANLYEALSRMRCESDDRKLWIDAICIDQANREERNHQVQVMRGIYADASGVLVWLGPSAEGSDLIFRLKHDERLSQVFDPSWDTSPSAETKAFLALLSRTYWHRVWVQQELLLARRYTIHCGGGQIDDVDLTNLMSIIPKHKPDYILEFDENRHKEQYYTKIRESHAFNVITIKERKISVPALSRLGAWIEMSIRANLQTSEPRDVIYAMLGISSDCMNGEIVPDYGKPVINIYREVLQLCGAQSASPTFQHKLAWKLGLEHGEICNIVKSAVCPWR